MQLNDRTDYGLRVLILLGDAGARVATHTIASTYGLSPSHTQKVVQALESAGFVETQRGRHGGVTLARPADQIRVGDVVRALEPHLGLVRCLRPGESDCILDGGCALKGALRRAGDAFLAELDSTTLSDVLKRSPHLVRLREAVA